MADKDDIPLTEKNVQQEVGRELPGGGDVEEGSPEVYNTNQLETTDKNKATASHSKKDVSKIDTDQKEEDLSALLPPEIWVQILKPFAQNQDVVPLRLVSRHFKMIVDDHKTFAVKMNGLKTRSIPGSHVRMHELSIKKFLALLSTTQAEKIFHHLEKLKKFKVLGPTHPSVVHHILMNAINLNTIQMNGLSFDVAPDQITNRATTSYQTSIPSIRHLFKLSSLIYYHPNSIHFENMDDEDFPINLLQDITRMEGFARGVRNMLCLPIRLPLLTKLSLQYDQLSITLIYELCDATLIPFIKAHADTLNCLQIQFNPEIHAEFSSVLNAHDAATNFRPQPASTTSMTKLKHLCMVLPDAALNGILKAIWHKETVPQNMLEILILEWQAPFKSVPDMDALQVVQQLLYKNNRSLTKVIMEESDAENFLAFDMLRGDAGHRRVQLAPQIFTNLRNLRMDGRMSEVEDNGPFPPFNLQAKLTVQSFPKLVELSLCNIDVNVRALQELILFRCPSLEQLELEALNYENENQIDEEFLRFVICMPCRIKEIRIEVYDLCIDWADAYWDIVKRIPVHSMGVDSADYLVIKP